MSDLVASLISLGFAVLALVRIWRWIGGEMARASDAKFAVAKRSFMYSLLAFLLLIVVGIGIVLVGFDRNPMRATMLGLGTVLAGIVPVMHWMVLSQVGFMGLKGEGGVALSAQSRRELRPRLLASVAIAFAAASLLIWLGGRDPPPIPIEYIGIGAVALGAVAVMLPMFVLKRCVDRDRAGRSVESSPAVQR
jgi:hypothetical protein